MCDLSIEVVQVGELVGFNLYILSIILFSFFTGDTIKPSKRKVHNTNTGRGQSLTMHTVGLTNNKTNINNKNTDDHPHPYYNNNNKMLINVSFRSQSCKPLI